MDRSKSIELLNTAIGDELQAIHQYLYWHFHLEDQGLIPLAMLFRKTAIEEMHHLSKLSERVLFLKGDIDMNPSGPVERITDPEAIVRRAAEMESKSADDYNNFAKQCSEHADSASKQLFEGLVADEERHFDGFDTRLDHIKAFGPQYLALESFQNSQNGAAPAAE
ncbi:MAG: bacterioferritin [Planctomycetota bacterium]|nr:MAG: bacterioferritin [Planctomycetota bacterium]